MPLDMRNEAVFARQDLAFAMRNSGLPIPFIMDQLGFTVPSTVHHCIAAGKKRSETNDRRISPRHFGVEMEFNGCSRPDVRTVIVGRDPNFPMQIESYNHAVRDHWKLITDSSVSGTGTYDDSDRNSCGEGLEMVSPILLGKAGFDQLGFVTDAIQTAGGEVDGTCGLHVHHDCRDLTPKQIAYLLGLYIHNQTTIDLLLAPSRRSTRNNTWCRPWFTGEKTQVIQDAAADRGRFGNYDRYRTINVTSYPRYGSIEFRQHQGTLNLDKITAWVKFGQSMVEASMKFGADEQPPEFGPDRLVPMLEWLNRNGGLPKATASYMTKRADQYAARLAAR